MLKQNPETLKGIDIAGTIEQNKKTEKVNYSKLIKKFRNASILAGLSLTGGFIEQHAAFSLEKSVSIPRTEITMTPDGSTVLKDNAFTLIANPENKSATLIAPLLQENKGNGLNVDSKLIATQNGASLQSKVEFVNPTARIGLESVTTDNGITQGSLSATNKLQLLGAKINTNLNYSDRGYNLDTKIERGDLSASIKTTESNTNAAINLKLGKEVTLKSAYNENQNSITTGIGYQNQETSAKIELVNYGGENPNTSFKASLKSNLGLPNLKIGGDLESNTQDSGDARFNGELEYQIAEKLTASIKTNNYDTTASFNYRIEADPQQELTDQDYESRVNDALIRRNFKLKK